MLVAVMLITFIGSVLVTWLLPIAFKSEPPYGVAVDIGVGTLVGLIWAYITFQYLAPMIGLKGWLQLIGSAGDAIGFAAIMLWVLRKIKS
ncbi:MAG: hypothetical protein GY803_06605 [Chloroflexi bacterium]|nr:hypothetical protein [Chloroflexota bacterium]